MTLLFLALGAAFAQDAVDAHGITLTPNDGDKLDYLTTWRPEVQTRGSFGINGLFEYASAPLTLVRQANDGALDYTTLVDDLFGLNLTAFGSPSTRVGIGASMPIWFTSVGPNGAEGVATGDLRLAVPVGVVLPDPQEGGFGLSIVPFIDLPTGAGARFLGNQGVAGGGTLAAGWSSPEFTIDGNAGIDVTPNINYQNLRGGSKFIGAFGLGYAVNDWLGLRGELNYRPSLSTNAIPGTEAPGEYLLSARGSHKSGLNWTVGGAGPFTKGATAAKFRLFLGLGYTAGKASNPDTDGDGILDNDDACPTQPETVNDYNDTDGCPDELADLVLTIYGAEGKPVSNATFVSDGKEYTSDNAGKIRRDDVLPGTPVGGPVRQAGYGETELKPVVLREGLNELSVSLEALPGKVRVITRTESGTPIDAHVEFKSDVPKEALNVGDDGQEILELGPGEWRLFISAPSFGTERRDLTMKAGEMNLIVIEVVMKPAKTEVTQREIKVLEPVYFDFDKDSILADSLPLLREVSTVLLQHPEIKLIEVQGHTDDKGNDRYNVKLSQRRVDTVRQFLVEQGVSPDRLVAKGYGEAKPVATNDTEAGRAANRRVQFVILDPKPANAEGTAVEVDVKPQGATRPTEGK